MFQEKPVKAVLLDITGVLVDGGAIPGSVEAVQKLKKNGIEVRFVTNETQRTRKSLVAHLHSLGYSMEESEVFPPALAMAKLGTELNLKPYLLVHPNCMEDLARLKNSEEPNAVILGDATDGFSYENMNKAFRILMKDESCLLYTLGKSKYYKEEEGLVLDVGPFTTALEFATGKSAQIVGKPSKEFFMSALNDIGASPEEAVMVGDDVVSDVGGAQKCGIRGVLVRTGKYRRSDENHPDVKPDKIVDNLAHFVNDLLA